MTEKHLIILIKLILLFCVAVQSVAAGERPEISSISLVSGNKITITGTGFGEKCADCEVIATYSSRVRYSLLVTMWSDRKIKTSIPRLPESSSRVSIQIHTEKGLSNSRVLTMNSRERLVATETRSHDLSVGDKGEDKFKLQGKKPACGAKALLFSRADIKFLEKRFSDAKVVASPSPGCITCGPVVVRWYNEPTGKLKYELRLFSQSYDGICPERLRRGV